MARTLLEVQLARLLYPLLIELATARETLTYRQMIERAQARYPDDQRVTNLIPVRMGRILWVIYDFLEERDLPRLTLLIVSAGSQYPGSAMWRHDCAAEQERCFAYDWTTVDQKFDIYSQASEKAVTPLRPVSREQAKRQMSAHFRDPTNCYPSGISALREAIIENIMNGLSVEDAFQIEAQLLTQLTRA